LALPGLDSNHIPYEIKQRIWLAYKHKLYPYAKQSDFLHSTATHRIIAGGNRSGKTETVGTFEVPPYLLWPDTRGWWIAVNYSLCKSGWAKIRRVLVEELDHKEVPRRRGLQQGEFHYSSRDNAVYMWTGSSLHFKSADNPDSLHAEPLHYAVIDEAGIFPYELYDTRIVPRLVDYGGWIAAVGTFETGAGAWFEDYFHMGQGENEYDIQSFILPTTGNPYVDQEWLAQQKKRLTEQGMEDIYNARYLAMPIPNQARVYPNLSVVTHGNAARCTYDPDLPVYVAVDPGGVYAVAAIQVKTLEGIGPSICMIDEVYHSRTVTTYEIIEECSRKEWWHNVGVGDMYGVIDVNAKEQKRIWAMAGVPLAARKVGIHAGIQAFAAFVNSGRFLFHPKCVNLNLEALRYQYPQDIAQEKDTRGRKPIDRFNHLLKALSYFVVVKFGFQSVDELQADGMVERISRLRPRTWARYGMGKIELGV